MAPIEVESKIWIDQDLYSEEYEYMHGRLKDKAVTFTYVNTKTGKEKSTRVFVYKKALELARERRRDGRYKNYEYEITL